MIVKKTIELSKKEKDELCKLFLDVFDKEMNLETFEKKFGNNSKGYSYHSLLIDDDKIIGCYSCIPYEYQYFGEKLLFGLSVDTMIHKEHRGNPFIFKKLATSIYTEMEKDGVSFVFGFPNENVYLVRKKILKWKDIGKLKYYILPINIGAIKKKFAIFNIFSKAYAMLVNLLTIPSLSKKNFVAKNIIKYDNIKYKDFRYDNSYYIYDFVGGYFSYKIYNEEGIQTLYIIDVYPLTKENLENAVKYAYKVNHKKVDLIMYVGLLDFNVRNLIKVPEKFEPKTVHMSGKILNKKIRDDIYDIVNWNVNLSNYDVR